jgi:hypothetical protein
MMAETAATAAEIVNSTAPLSIIVYFKSPVVDPYAINGEEVAAVEPAVDVVAAVAFQIL